MTAQDHDPYLTDPTGREHLLTDEVTSIGRAVENQIVITSKRVSREHVRLRREGWRTILEDLGSTNGSYLNEARVEAPTSLRDGDQIKVGDVVFTFHDPDVTTRDTLGRPTLEVDVSAGEVRVNRQVISLSAKEFVLLAYLYEQQGQVCSKDEIGQVVWPEYEDSVYDYQIENLVRRLRSKLEPDTANPQILLTVRGLGYKLAYSL